MITCRQTLFPIFQLGRHLVIACLLCIAQRFFGAVFPPGHIDKCLFLRLCLRLDGNVIIAAQSRRQPQLVVISIAFLRITQRLLNRVEGCGVTAGSITLA